MKIVLIACSKTKQKQSCKACQMYQGNLFKLSYAYAKKISDRIYILSAKYGLLSQNEIIDTYDKTLKRMRSMERKEWAEKVYDQMNKNDFFQNNNELIFLAGSDYREQLIALIQKNNPNIKCIIPMGNLRQGEQLQYLKQNI